MPYSVAQSVACNLVDTNQKVSVNLASQVAAIGYKSVIRYLPLPGVDPKGDIDAAEIDAILNAGLAVLLVQHVRFAGWNPAKFSGKTDALEAIEFAQAAGYLQGAHIYLDLEGISGTSAATKQFAEDWSAAVVQTGFSAGCYVGFNVPLNAVQLYDLHNFHTYWAAPGPRSIATRGFAITQKTPAITIGGVNFDADTLQADKLGDTPFWMVNQAPAEVA